MSDVQAVRRLSPPPRRVPLDVFIRVVLGSAIGQVGWLLIGFGLVFVWAFDADGAVVSAFRFFGREAIASGTATGWREMSLTINDVTVFETSYAFEVDGRSYTGASYATGDYVPEGTQVTVEYRPSAPAISRIAGMRATSVGLPIVFVFIVPLIGFALMRAGLQRGLRASRLLSEGRLAQATLATEEPTKMEVNERPVWKLTFHFTAGPGGTYEVVAKTHEPHRLKDEETERVVYDPRDPSDAVLMDDLPGRPVVDERGELASGGPAGMARALLCLVLPAVTILGHGWFLFLTR